MAFPATALPLRVYIAPGAPAATQSDTGDWTWSEITDDVRVADGVRIEAGRGDEAAAVDPGRCTLTLNNRDGHYSPRNVLGQWYGQIGRGTPLQVRVDLVADTFTRSTSNGWGTSDSGYTWSHTGASSWSTNGTRGLAAIATANTAVYAILDGVGCPDADFTYSVSLDAVTTGAEWLSVALLRYADTNNMLRVYTRFLTDGTIALGLTERSGGVNTDLADSATGLTYSAGTRIWTRCQVVGPAFRAKVWEDGDPEPDTWHATYSLDGAVGGTGLGFYEWRAIGNTNAGTLTASIDDLSIQAILFTGNVLEWPVRWDKSGNDCWTPITAAGILRRLQQGASPLHSPMRRWYASVPDVVGYWPLEDAASATSAASGLAGGRPARMDNVTFAAADDLAGSAAVLEMVDDTTTGTGVFPSHSTPTAWQFGFSVRMSDVPAVETSFMTLTTNGTAKTWRFAATATDYKFYLYDEDGTLVDSYVGTFGTGAEPGEWLAFIVEAEQDGGNVDWLIRWVLQDSVGFFTGAQSFAGTAGRLTGWSIAGHAGGSGVTTTAYGHVIGVANNDWLWTSGHTDSFRGYTGEEAADRIVRLADEEAVPVIVESADESSTLGVQRSVTFLELLQVAADADQGLLYESGLGLAYRPRYARYNQPVDLALDFDEGHIAEPPEPTDDDQRLRNDWTVARDGGSSARYEDTAHITAHGRYDEATTINVDSDDVLPYHAGWRVHLGTWDALRWPRIELNLAAAPELIPLWLQCGVGSRVTIANPPDEVLGEEIDVLVEGYAQTLGPFQWDVTLNCSPARPWDTAVEGAAKADSGSSTTSGDFDAGTDTSLTVASTGEVWSTDSGEYPLDIRVSGVVLTVTAVSGSSSPQTFTITQTPVNGITKTIPSGSAVVLADPTIVAL